MACCRGTMTKPPATELEDEEFVAVQPTPVDEALWWLYETLPGQYLWSVCRWVLTLLGLYTVGYLAAEHFSFPEVCVSTTLCILGVLMWRLPTE